ncbi:copper amine oxidase N-terminal domain-containing protein [Paenibacillus sp. FSL E2-0230]|uniref:copper amine oxidase N-terminal domain-containing protein n=1 Tax=Paenibacillus sp. FSL E2-0230 TaxID=2954727 RepID=UPI0030D498BE
MSKHFWSRVQKIVIVTVVLVMTMQTQIENTSAQEEYDLNRTVLFNNKLLELETAPVTKNGVTLVPFRKLAEKFDAEVQVKKTNQSMIIHASNFDTEIELTIGSKKVRVNNEEKLLLTAPQVVNGYTMVPLRFITESFGGELSKGEYRWIADDIFLSINYDVLRKLEKMKIKDTFTKSANFPHWMPDGSIVLKADGQLWRYYNGEYTQIESPPLEQDESIYNVAVAPNGNIAVTTSNDDNLWLRTGTTWKNVKSPMPGFPALGQRVHFSMKSEIIYSASTIKNGYEFPLFMYSNNSWNTLADKFVGVDRVLSLPDGTLIMNEDVADEGAVIWQMKKGVISKLLTIPDVNTTGLSALPDGSLALTTNGGWATDKTKIYLYRNEKLTPIEFPPDIFGGEDILLLSQDRFIVALPGGVYLWNEGKYKLIADIDDIESMEMLANGDIILASRMAPDFYILRKKNWNNND